MKQIDTTCKKILYSYKKDFFNSPVKNKDNSSKNKTTDSGTKDDSK